MNNITPKEKAQELYDYFRYNVRVDMYLGMPHNAIVESITKMVDEILDTLHYDEIVKDDVGFDNVVKFWEEVKVEIKNYW